MKKFSFTLLASAFALAGCYSSGGGGGSVATPASQEFGTTNSASSSTANSNSQTAPSTGSVTTDPSVKVTESTGSTATDDRTGSVDQKTLETTSQQGITAEVVRTAFANTFGSSANAAVQGGVLTFKSDAITAENPKSTDFDVLFLGDAQLLLLATPDDKWGDISTRALTASDIRKNPQNQAFTGQIGSTKVSRYQQRLFENMRFGVITHEGLDSLVVQGKPTALRESSESNLNAMPNSGFFGYDGFALYGKAGSYQQLTARALVDFAKNTLEVRLTDPNDSTKKLTFGGTISGNTFSGTQNGIETKGGFYGDRAADLGGVFYVLEGESKANRGVFGASDKFRANASE